MCMPLWECQPWMYCSLCQAVSRSNDERDRACPLSAPLGSCLCETVVGGLYVAALGSAQGTAMRLSARAWARRSESEGQQQRFGRRETKGRQGQRPRRCQDAAGTTRQEGHDLDWAVDAVDAHASTQEASTRQRQWPCEARAMRQACSQPQGPEIFLLSEGGFSREQLHIAHPIQRTRRLAKRFWGRSILHHVAPLSRSRKNKWGPSWMPLVLIIGRALYFPADWLPASSALTTPNILPTLFRTSTHAQHTASPLPCGPRRRHLPCGGGCPCPGLRHPLGTASAMNSRKIVSRPSWPATSWWCA